MSQLTRTPSPHDIDRAWITGVITAFSVLLLALAFQQMDAPNRGISILGWHTAHSREVALTALFSVACIAFIAEAMRLAVIEKTLTLTLQQDVTANGIAHFVLRCLLRYIEAVATIWLVIAFYKTAGEYGFARDAEFYRAWFRCLDFMWQIVLCGALPYILITQAFFARSHQPNYGLFALLRVHTAILLKKQTEAEKLAYPAVLTSLRGTVLRLFFLPLATVLFVDYFTSLITHLDTLFTRASEHTQLRHAEWNREVFKLAMALILSISSAIAWCGYALCSRWLNNYFRSVDATLFGWVVCLMHFPPFTLSVTWFFKGPSEAGFMNFANPTWVSLLMIIFIGSSALALSAILCFGARYSNLTHRGIIRHGPYRFVRHPEYAAANIGWWCTGLPFIISVMNQNRVGEGVTLLIGLSIFTTLYYLRALTEERHLLHDPDYVDYCKKVKYRFVPGVL